MRWSFLTIALLPFLLSAAPAGDRLLPLSDKDAYSSNETGCEFGFRQGRETYLFMIGHSLIVRTAPGRAGLNVCRITDRQFGAFGDGAATIACAGRTFSVRRTERVVSHEESDSADGPAMLTMRRGRQARTIRGNWGSAC